MPSTFTDLNAHVIFSTKNRHSIFHGEDLSRLHHYLAGCIRGMEVHPIQVGGVADHVHLLFGFRATQSIAALVQEIKKSSNKWVRSELGKSGFSWQEGYAAFSVSHERLGPVDRYIQRQEEHHRKKTFQDEYRVFLKKYDVDYDERYVWD